MRLVDTLILHCADTPNGKMFHNTDIDSWHKERGFKRQEDWVALYSSNCPHIGYHYVILPDGDMEAGRSPEEVGAHCEGHNSHSIGICLVGRDKFTQAAWNALYALIVQLKARYPNLIIKGHYEYDTAKAQGKICPNFSVSDYANTFMPKTENIYVG